MRLFPEINVFSSKKHFVSSFGTVRFLLGIMGRSFPNGLITSIVIISSFRSFFFSRFLVRIIPSRSLRMSNLPNLLRHKFVLIPWPVLATWFKIWQIGSLPTDICKNRKQKTTKKGLRPYNPLHIYNGLYIIIIKNWNIKYCYFIITISQLCYYRL